jgi:hypothetical protein
MILLAHMPIIDVELDALGVAILNDLLKGLALLETVAADVELGQRPIILDGRGKDLGTLLVKAVARNIELFKSSIAHEHVCKGMHSWLTVKPTDAIITKI